MSFQDFRGYQGTVVAARSPWGSWGDDNTKGGGSSNGNTKGGGSTSSYPSSGYAPVDPGYRDVTGSGGYYYRQWPDGKILILPGSKASAGVYLTGGSAWQAITNEIGPYPGTEVSNGAASVIGAIASLFQKGGDPSDPNADPTKKQQTAATIAGAVQTYGPSIVDAVSSLIQNRRSSMASLQAQLARKLGQYAKATNPSRKVRLAYQIKSLQAQIAGLQSTQQVAMTQVSAPVETSTWSSTLPIIVIAGGGLLVLTFVLATRKPKGAR